MELKVAEASTKVYGLSETLAKKEEEMVGMEERFRKYIEKANYSTTKGTRLQEPGAGA